ncbi:hypothetical protein [Kitasatospora sp. MAA19]|uniref:hypothetical protein n=1 Tax=Kitasatospora sp. MAA19 TaxID=3035090 RepID=UPI002475A16E|nr:hypothetical protein [Kitasatospora sp. MAA19]
MSTAAPAWPQMEQLHVRRHGAFACVKAELADGERGKLTRLRYTGAVGRWGFTPYYASSDRYEDSLVPTGRPMGAAADALDCACRLHLAVPDI